MKSRIDEAKFHITHERDLRRCNLQNGFNWNAFRSKCKRGRGLKMKKTGKGMPSLVPISGFQNVRALALRSVLGTILEPREQRAKGLSAMTVF